MDWHLLLVLALVLGAEFVNGWTDAPNAIATVVSTRVMTPRAAVVLATFFNMLGTLCGTAVAETIGKGIVDLASMNPDIIIATMISIILWSCVTVHFGIPTSKSHELVAGMSGAALAVAGPPALVAAGWVKVFWGLILSSFFGFVISFIMAKCIIAGCREITPCTAKFVFGKLQIVSSMLMALNHGMNDGQKFIGIFSMTLVVANVLPHFYVPLWVILLCAFTMGAGTMVGGWKIIKNVGMRMVDIRPWQGFAAETSASGVIFGASLGGIPLSTTHTITTAIMGVAAAKNIRGVRWNIVGNIVLAWVITFPLCAVLSFLITLVLTHLI
ncbi:MAG TPA: inorganic phosphate transporter [bacterium]|nr:inorganic phosphate transporter [bacterium]